MNENNESVINEHRLSMGALFFSVIFIIFSLLVIPSNNIPADFLKSVGFSIFTLLTFGVLGVLTIKGGFSVPKSLTLLIPLIILGVSFISSYINRSLVDSWAGVGYEADTIAFLVSFFVLFVSASIFFGSKKGIQMLFGVLFLLFLLVTLLEIVDLFFIPFMVDKSSTVVGHWFNLGIFYSFYILLFALFLEFYKPRGIRLALISLVLSISVLALILIGFPLMWKLIWVYALLLCAIKIYPHSTPDDKNETMTVYKPKNPPYYLLLLLVVAFIFSVYQPSWSGAPNIRNVTEIKPSPVASFVVLRGLYQENFKSVLLGAGPNKFGESWTLYKPREVNQTPFWNTDFGQASSLFVTFLITTGLLGAFSWILFLFYTHADFFRAIMGRIKDGEKVAPVMIFGALSSFGFATIIFYNPGPVVLAMTAIMSGATIGLSSKDAFYVQTGGRRLVVYLIGVLTLAVLIFGFVGISKRVIAINHYQKGIGAFQAKDIPLAIDEIEKAASLYESDLFERSLSEIYQVKLSDLLASDSVSKVPKFEKEALIKQMRDHAQNAIKLNPNNYLNYITLGNVYTRLGLIGAPETDGGDVGAYAKAIKLNPSSPIPHYLYGRYLAIIGKREGARKELELALSLKPDYKEAVDLLNQLK